MEHHLDGVALPSADRSGVEAGIHQFAARPFAERQDRGVEASVCEVVFLAELPHPSSREFGPHRRGAVRVEAEHVRVRCDGRAEHLGAVVHFFEVFSEEGDGRGVQCHGSPASSLGLLLDDDSASVVDRRIDGEFCAIEMQTGRDGGQKALLGGGRWSVRV